MLMQKYHTEIDTLEYKEVELWQNILGSSIQLKMM